MNDYSDKTLMDVWLKRSLHSRFDAVVKESVPESILHIISEIPEGKDTEDHQDART